MTQVTLEVPDDMLVEQEVVQRTPTLRQMAEDAYREGRGGILELLDADRALKDVEFLHLRQLELAKLAEQDLIAAVGWDAP